ncbi:hypothetical protein [Nevskia sp.]|uniref:hypothetical protein n=1 Tax=Nevskia sp. TaxID=1929292 RepID=UPI0025F76155|nr:hypothetical protein [Nevskia sp.]
MRVALKGLNATRWVLVAVTLAPGEINQEHRLQSTVLVIGAGASAELHFPVGTGLASRISTTSRISFDAARHSEFPQNAEFFSIAQAALAKFRKYSGDAAVALEKMRQLSLGVQLASSIDNYLHLHQSDEALVMLGKLAIAYEIAGLEQGSALAEFRQDGTRRSSALPMDTWHISFFRAVTEQCPLIELPERFKAVTIISFNYDRVFEKFLLRAIMEQYNTDESAAAAAMKPLVIYHPYGSLGRLKTEDPVGGWPYGERLFTDNVIKMAGAIRTFTEGMEANDVQQHTVGERLRSADRTVFLGFGFLPANMKLLDSLIGDKKGMVPYGRFAYGTCFKASIYNERHYKEALAKLLHIGPEYVELKDLECRDFFPYFLEGLRFV